MEFFIELSREHAKKRKRSHTPRKITKKKKNGEFAIFVRIKKMTGGVFPLFFNFGFSNSPPLSGCYIKTKWA